MKIGDIKVRTRLIGFIILLTVSFLLSFLFFRHIERKAIISLFKESAQEKENVFDKILQLKGNSLETLVFDYTYWDEMLAAVNKEDRSWAMTNVSESVLSSYKVNAVWLYKPDKQLFYFISNINNDGIKKLNLPGEFFDRLYQRRLDHFFINSPAGLLEVRSGTIHPGDDEKRQANPQGFLFSAILWNDSYIKELSEITNCKITLSPGGKEGNKTSLDLQNGVIAFSRSLNSWEGQPLKQLTVFATSKEIKDFNEKSKAYFVFLFIFLGILAGVAVFFVVNWIFLPIHSVSLTLKSENLKYIQTLQGKDTEFGDIARLVSNFFQQKQELLEEINERERVEALNQQLAAIVDSTDDGVIGEDLNGTIISWNMGAQKIYDYYSEEIKGRSISILVPADRPNEIFEIFEKIKKGESVINFETVRLRKDGSLINVSLTISPVKDSSGNIIGVSSIARDISEWKRADEELKRAKESAVAASRAKSDFLANMSHELRTPLNAIIGFSDVLKEGSYGPLNDQQKDFIGDISSSGEHLLALINNILDLSKIESGKVELEISEVDLANLLNNSIILIKNKAIRHNIHIAMDIPEDIGLINADETRIKQVVFNLLFNAVKFTPDGGKIGIEARKLNNEISVTVWDTGIGIDPKGKEKLFKEFEQVDSSYARKYGGTGLGLAISKRIIELHSGRIFAESEGVNKGSRFTFVIPVKLKL